MAIPVLVMGRSGAGKTYSLKNFAPNEVGVISVEKGRLPFRSQLKVVRIPAYEKSENVTSMAQANTAKYAWLMGVIQKSKTKAIVIDDSQYLMANELFDRANEKGYDKFTNMLDEKLCVEGCFDIVIYCADHKFYTQSNGQSTAKSPEDMFELEIPNDLKAVDAAIREYYGLGGEHGE